jgi:hypothetical protein
MVFSASIRQLKRLLYNYHARRPQITICGFFNAAALQVSEALLKTTTRDVSWKFYFWLCFQFWKEAYICYRVFFQIVRGTLAMALEAGAITSTEAKGMLEEFRNNGRHHDTPEDAVTSSILDFRRAVSNRQDAQIDALSKRFDELVTFYDFTSGEFEHPVTSP